jgi:hypothetical protein
MAEMFRCSVCKNISSRLDPAIELCGSPECEPRLAPPTLGPVLDDTRTAEKIRIADKPKV